MSWTVICTTDHRNRMGKKFFRQIWKVFCFLLSILVANVSYFQFSFHSDYSNFEIRSSSDQSFHQFFNVSPPPPLEIHVDSLGSAVHSLSSTPQPAFLYSGWSSSESSDDATSDSNSSYDQRFDCTSSIRHDGSSTNSIGSTTSSYTFNPLSIPFQPMQKGTMGIVPSEAAIAAASMVTHNQSMNDLSTAFSMNIHHFSKYVCILCPKTFSTAIELKQHIENKALHPFDCVICGTSFTHGYQLTRHLWIHLKNHRRIRQFDCRACYKKFRTLNQLHKHYELCRYKLYLFHWKKKTTKSVCCPFVFVFFYI